MTEDKDYYSMSAGEREEKAESERYIKIVAEGVDRALRRQNARIARGINILFWVAVASYLLFYKEWWQPILGFIGALLYFAVYFPGKWLGFWN